MQELHRPVASTCCFDRPLEFRWNRCVPDSPRIPCDPAPGFSAGGSRIAHVLSRGASRAIEPMSERLQHGRLRVGSPTSSTPASTYCRVRSRRDPGARRGRAPGEWPDVRRRLRAEGVRARQHRGMLLLEPASWTSAPRRDVPRRRRVVPVPGVDDELEPFPGRVSSDMHDFNEGTPLGLENGWRIRGACWCSGTVAAQLATLDAALAARLRAQFRAAKE